MRTIWADPGVGPRGLGVLFLAALVACGGGGGDATDGDGDGDGDNGGIDAAPPPPDGGPGDPDAMSPAADAAAPVADAGPPGPDATWQETPLPMVTGVQPGSPANANDPVVLGTAAPNATVEIHGTPSCAAAVLGTGTADAVGSFAVAVAVDDDTTYTLRARATAPGALPSGCSTSFILFVEDSTAPDAPELTSTTPASPAQSAMPQPTGEAEPGALVRIYAGDCTGTPLATGTAGGAGNFTLPVPLAADGSFALVASARDAAGNVSGCSAPLVHVRDTAAPDAPGLDGTTPEAPSSDATPLITGTAEDGAGIELFLTDDCSGTPLASGSAAGGSFSIEVTVDEDAATTIYARATDAAGNPSACSAGLVYTEDSTPPGPPTDLETSPASPSKLSTAPTVSGVAEAGATVEIHADGACDGPPLATTTADALGGFSVTVDVPANATTTLFARAVDEADNASDCGGGLAYRHDDVAPAAPALVSVPGSPANDDTPDLSGTTEAGAAVALFTGGDCASAPLATTSADGDGDFTFAPTVSENAPTTFRVIVTDLAGNPSACGPALVYVEDSLAPAPPVVGAASPAVPSDDNAPELSGTAEPGASISLFRDPTCTLPAAGGAVAQLGGAWQITSSVADSTQTTFWATAKDAAGNLSACSTTFATYVEQSASPRPSISGVVTGPPGAGRIYLVLERSCGAGCTSLELGTSVPGYGPFLIRGVESTGSYRLFAYRDTGGPSAYTFTADAAGERAVTVSSPTGNLSGQDVTLAAAPAGAPGAVTQVQAVGGPGGVLALWQAPEDVLGNELADQYQVFIGDSAAVGPADHVAEATVSVGSDAYFFTVPDGTYHVAVRALRQGSPGALSPPAPVTTPATGGHTVSGTVSLAGLPTGTLYVVAFSETGDFALTRIPAAAATQPYAIEHVADGSYRIGAFVDVDGDQTPGPGDPRSFGDSGPSVTVAGADATAGLLTLPAGDTSTRFITVHHGSGTFDGYQLEVRVEENLRRPVTVTLEGGPQVTGPVDMPVAYRDDGSSFRLFRATQGTPVVGDAYPMTLGWADAPPSTQTPQVTGVIPSLPTPIAPVGSSAGDPQPLAPTLSWSAPATLPAGAYQYEIYLFRNAGQSRWHPPLLPQDTLSVEYDFDGSAGDSPLLPATAYEWNIAVVDAFGNRGQSHASFTTP